MNAHEFSSTGLSTLHTVSFTAYSNSVQSLLAGNPILPMRKLSSLLVNVQAGLNPKFSGMLVNQPSENRKGKKKKKKKGGGRVGRETKDRHRDKNKQTDL